MGHTEKYCEKPLIKISLPGFKESSSCLLFSSENNWNQGMKMTFSPVSLCWETEKNFKFGLWEFKFLVDRKYWVVSPNYKTKLTSDNYLNNYI